MIILFEENELLFNSLGLGILRDAKSCLVTSELNDSFEVTLMYPYKGINSDKIKIDRIIYCKVDPFNSAQPFRIYSVSKPIKDFITIKAQHISYDMNGLPVNPIHANGLRDAVDKIQNGSVVEHNFKIYTEKSDSKKFSTDTIYNMRALLMGDEGSILSKYDLEISFDKFNVYLTDRIGANRGATISYAKNLKDINHEISYDRLYNGVYPFYHRETTETTTETASGEFKQVYIVGTKPFQDGWLSYTDAGEPYHPVDEAPVQIATDGDYYQKVYCWNPTIQRYVEKVYNEMISIADFITGALNANEDAPQWVVIEWNEAISLKIVLKAGEDGYFKMSNDTDWTYHKKGEIVYQGSIKDATNAMVVFYSQVIPDSSSSEVSENTSVTHVELKDKIIWIDTELAQNMKYNRILTLDLSTEFDDVPDEDALEAKAKEYIEKNKIGQYKFDTNVNFVDLTTTTEGVEYINTNHIELGDTVRVIYNDVGIDIELRVVSTTYDVINNKYTSIVLGEKPDKLSGDTVQQGDGVSSLTNDVGFVDVTTVNKLIAKIVTADFIKAKNAELTKAQIEQLETARIKCSGIIEASQFELDNLIAKMLTADNAVIKQTLEAGTVKVKGDITIDKGSIKINNEEKGTLFVVDRDGNVTANSLNITGGSIKIQETFEVTNEGLLSAVGANISGTIIAESGNIAGFTIQNGYLEYGNPERGQYIYIGTDGIELGAINPVTTRRIFELDSNGSLYAVNATIKGSIEATSGKIAEFTINNNILESVNNNKFLTISTGYALDQKLWFLTAGAIENDVRNIIFGVTTTGKLIAKDAEITGKIVAQSGKLAGFTIASNESDPGEEPISGYILYGQRGYNNSVYIGTDGIELGTKFSVDIAGNITAQGGLIAGFIIQNGYLEYDGGQLSTEYVKIGNNIISLGKTSISDPTPIFSVTSQGHLVANDATIKGVITATSGLIAGFTISETRNNLGVLLNGHISYGKSSFSDTNNGIYIGTDGISLGANSVFNVTPTGILTADSVNISGTISTISGNIAGFTIQNGYLEYGDEYGDPDYNPNIVNEFIHVGTDGIQIGRSGMDTTLSPYTYQFEVTDKGILTAKQANISGTITADSLTANISGNIAGFSITSAGLYGSDISTGYRVHITPSGEYLGSKIDLYLSSSHWSYRDIYNGYNGPYAGALMLRGGEMLVEGFQSASGGQVYNYRLPLEAMVTQAFGITNSPIQIGFYRVNNISASTTSGSFTIDNTNGSILAVTANYIGAGRESSIGVSWSGRTVTWRRSATTQAVDMIFIYICSAKAV